MIQDFTERIGAANFRILTQQNEQGDLLKVSAIWEVPTDEIDELEGITRTTIREYLDA